MNTFISLCVASCQLCMNASNHYCQQSQEKKKGILWLWLSYHDSNGCEGFPPQAYPEAQLVIWASWGRKICWGAFHHRFGSRRIRDRVVFAASSVVRFRQHMRFYSHGQSNVWCMGHWSAGYWTIFFFSILYAKETSQYLAAGSSGCVTPELHCGSCLVHPIYGVSPSG